MRAAPRTRHLPAGEDTTGRRRGGSRAAPPPPPADRAPRRRCALALRAQGGASSAASLCPRQSESAGRQTGGIARSPHPAGRDTRAARFFLEIGEGLLVVLNGLRQARLLCDRLDALPLDRRTLDGIVPVDEVGRERVDAGLNRVGERLITIELGLERFQAAGPVRLILDGRILCILCILCLRCLLCVLCTLCVLCVFSFVGGRWRRHIRRRRASFVR